MTNDDRLKLVHGYVTDWSLSIGPVNEEDSGEYICQINTEPQMVTKINLHVLCMLISNFTNIQSKPNSKKITALIKVPPKIIEEKSTISPEPVREGDTLALYCHTEGIPKPKVSWYFRKRSQQSHHHNSVNDRSAVAQQTNAKTHEQVFQEGDTLIIKNVSRLNSGIFECIANNSVPPAASRKIKVSIECMTRFFFQFTKTHLILY